jgi:hypothetical protein
MTTMTNGGWIEEIPQVEIELAANGNVHVTDCSDFDGRHTVTLHPIHLRLIAEKLGLVREMSASEADALRTVDKLTRRLNLLHERIAKMDSWLWEHRDFDEADINVEVWFSKATLDLSTEFQAEIAEASRHVTPRHAESRSLKASENGGLQATQKRGSSNAPQPTDNPAETQRVTKPEQMELQP